MTDVPDIRWKQRFSNYQRALSKLQAAVELSCTRPLSELEKQGVVQGFEMVFELAWTLLKDYLAWQGETGIAGSRDAFRQAFKRELIGDGEIWMDMIRSRNQAAHVYNEAIADAIIARVFSQYVEQFEALRSELDRRRQA